MYISVCIYIYICIYLYISVYVYTSILCCVDFMNCLSFCVWVRDLVVSGEKDLLWRAVETPRPTGTPTGATSMQYCTNTNTDANEDLYANMKRHCQYLSCCVCLVEYLVLRMPTYRYIPIYFIYIARFVIC